MELKNSDIKDMGTVDQLRQERNGRTIPLARFYADYKKDSSNICYGFVEGKNDPSYYRTIINNLLPPKCSIILYPSNGKENVKKIFEEINKRNYPQDRISFFMDRDLSSIIPDSNLIIAPNVYVTDNYSIENDILSDETLGNIICDILGFSSLPVEDLNKIKECYNIQKTKFQHIMMPIMANIILWKKLDCKPSNYNNLKVKDFIQINKCIISLQVSFQELIQILYTQSNMKYEIYDESTVEKIIKEIEEKKLSRQILRGKYLSVFFIKFCNSLYNDCNHMGFQREKGRELNINDIMDTIAPRSKPPYSLLHFIHKAILPYFNKI